MRGSLDRLPVTTDAVDYLLAGVNRYFPAARLTNADILRTFVGARPLLGGEEGASEDAVSRDDRVLNPAPGIWAITGGKLTTYRAMAKRLVDGLVRESFADRPSVPARRPRRCRARRYLSARCLTRRARVVEPLRCGGPFDRTLANEPELAERIDPRRAIRVGRSRACPRARMGRAFRGSPRSAAGGLSLVPECDLRPMIARWLEARGHHVQSAPEPVPHF